MASVVGGDWHTLYNALNYVYGQCTQYVAGTAAWVGRGWGNACQWADNAKRDGLSIGSTPVQGAIPVYDCSTPGSGGNGHVAVVHDVAGDGSFTISEANWDGFNKVDFRKETLDSATGKHIVGFILPPGVTGSAYAAKTTSGLPDPTQLSAAFQAVGTQIQKDITKVALVLLGFFTVVLGIALLLSNEWRDKAIKAAKGIPGHHAGAAQDALESGDKLAGDT